MKLWPARAERPKNAIGAQQTKFVKTWVGKSCKIYEKIKCKFLNFFKKFLTFFLTLYALTKKFSSDFAVLQFFKNPKNLPAAPFFSSQPSPY
jgi:hypothetical protein